VPLVRCPGCDKNLKVPDGRTGVRCPSCGEDFRLDGDRAEASRRERVRSAADDEGRRPARREDARPRRDPDDDDLDRPRRRRRLGPREKIVGLLPLLILGPPGLVFAVFAGFFVWAIMGALILGIPLMFVAIVMVYRVFWKEGRHGELDAVGRGRTGGGALLALQIGYAFKEPRIYACWVVLQLLGMDCQAMLSHNRIST
jgi:LSD1 subclass zinc finger protein